MRTVILHFLNEEFLLPWWLSHHVELFDHGILIDYGSTDNSIEICKSLAPHWLIVRSENEYFDAILCDFEAMKYEAEIDGWKLVLNVTEFLCSGNLKSLEAGAESNDSLGFRIPTAMMVDTCPSSKLLYDRPLVEQKTSGMATSWMRLYHRFKIGAYAPGRHSSFLPSCNDVSCEAMILKYAYSPWCDSFIKRKLQIGARIPPHDVRAGFGFHHMWSEDIMRDEYRKKRNEARDLTMQITLAASNYSQSDFEDGEFLLITHNKTILFLDRELGCLRHSSFLAAQLNLILFISGPVFQLYFYDPSINADKEIARHTQCLLLDKILVKKISNNQVVLYQDSQLLYSTPANNEDPTTSVPYEFAQYTLIPLFKKS
jgi:hypothetical protein